MKLNHKSQFELYLKQVFPYIVAEFKFHPVRRWRFDFAFPEIKIAFEYDGGVFMQGRHSRGAGMILDNEKINTAQIMGWKVFRVCTGQNFTKLIDEVEEIL